MSDSPTDSAARFDALEMRMAHQDRTIAELNDVITEQWRKIDALERRIQQVREEAQNMLGARDAPEPPPPHY